MKNLIRALAVEDGTDFEDICSFKTESFIGIYDHVSDRFVVMAQNYGEFNLDILPICTTLEELDKAVYAVCEEHITCVSESNAYQIIIEEE